MVKDDFHKTRALTDGSSEISIAREFDMYAFIYNLQEEAHRFAVKSSQGAKIKTMTHSTLEKIEGIGPAKAKALLGAMPLGKIRTATVEELSGPTEICSLPGRLRGSGTERALIFFFGGFISPLSLLPKKHFCRRS
jgi:excinuclease UvrABC nuclease subunit